MAQTIDTIAALPPEIIEHICIRFSAILRAVWVVDAAALGIGLLYFLFLIFQPKEPRPRLVKWGLTHRLYGVVYCDETRCMEEWWTTSISEYSAARGTTGAKLMAFITTAAGVTQIIGSPILYHICLTSRVSTVLFLVAGICCIILGQMESSHVTEGEGRDIQRTKAAYGQIHMWTAIGFIALTIAAMATSFMSEVAKGLSYAGGAAFVIFCILQSFTGTYVLGPSRCMCPQRPEDRNEKHPVFGFCHSWLNGNPRNLTWMGRISLLLELCAFFGVAFSFTLGMMIASGPGPCNACQELYFG